MTKREDTLIALWIAFWGAVFVLWCFAFALPWPSHTTMKPGGVLYAVARAVDLLREAGQSRVIDVGRGVYAVALAACVTALALRLLRRLRKTDGT